MAKITLGIEYEVDYKLVGIVSHSRDYKISWELNKLFGWNLTRGKDHEIYQNDIAFGFSFYEYTSDLNIEEYYLVSNKKFDISLIPEQKSLDYFLVMNSVPNEKINDTILPKLMYKTKSILTSFVIDPNNLPSKENLIFS